MIEQWIKIYHNLYSVSNLGRVKSNNRYINTKTGIRHFKGKILTPEITQDGHLRVVLCYQNKHKRVFVHRLVAKAFIPNPNNYPIINHKDENPQNNNINNLEWCTISYNNNYNNRNKKLVIQKDILFMYLINKIILYENFHQLQKQLNIIILV